MAIAKIKKHSASIRIWHWLNMLLIFGSLITVLINSTILDKQTAIDLINSKAGNVLFNNGELKSIIGTLRDEVWDIHIYLGYALTALLLFRIILEYFQVVDHKLLRKLSTLYMHFKSTKENREIARNKLAVKLIYSLFYILLLIMVLTGLTLVFKKDLGISRTLSHDIEEIHGFCMYLIIAFIVVHIVGVILAERKEKKAIVSDFIHGG